MRDVLIYGGGLLGRQVYNLLKSHEACRLRITGSIDDVLAPGTPVIEGLDTLGGLEALNGRAEFGPDRVSLVMAIGYSDMRGKGKAYERAKDKGYSFESVIHPRASLEPNVLLGEGCVVQAGVVLDQYVEAGPLNYFDIGVLVGECSRMGPNNYFSAGAVVGGSVTIGRDNFFGLNSAIVNDVTIGDNNFVNAQSLIHKDMASDLQAIENKQIRFMKRS